MLAIDLFCGIGGWTEGLLAEGYDVVGFDIERHEYGARRYPAQLVVQDVLTLHGGQFRDAVLIVASPPCQAYSYMAMPWTLAKAKAVEIRADTSGKMLADLNRLFEVCFRIQLEACEAAGRHVPMVVENVRGAQPWVGPARWHYGSYYLWGDVPALMPFAGRSSKIGGGANVPGIGWTGFADTGLSWRNRQDAIKVPGLNWSGSDKPGYVARAFNDTAVASIKNNGGSWFNVAHNTTSGKGQNPDGRKVPGFRFDGSGRSFQLASVKGLKASRRKEASAMIAKIPLPLAQYIASVFAEGRK